MVAARAVRLLGFGLLSGTVLALAGVGAASAAGAGSSGVSRAVLDAAFERLRGRVDVDTTGSISDAPSLLVDLPPPDLPAPVILTAPEPMAPMPVAVPAVAAPPREPAITLPPDAPVIVSASERIAGAVEILLAQGKAAWPARLPKREREAVASFYAARQNRPLWTGEGGWSDRGRVLAARLGAAADDGLDPAEYPVPRLGPADRSNEAADLAEAELKLAASLVLYGRDARGGRLDPSRLSALITPKLELPTVEAVLAALADTADAGAALDAFQPRYPGYALLKAKLADLRANRPAGVPMVRAPGRQAAAGVQKVAALDDVPAPAVSTRLEGDILANMERWRWLPAVPASRYIFVNIPEYRLRLFENGRVAHETRVITGKPESPTPIFSGTMDHAVVNPSWYIPPSIMKKEILPGLAADPAYAEKRGYQVIRRGNQITVRQPPGERNALGFIKFMFPNGHAVYLHDTPNRSLFSSARRAFSHGCVRVENPFLLADFVLGSEWTEQRLKKMIGRGERTIRMTETMPVHLAYFTVAVDEGGELRSFEDLYGYNRRVKAALGLGG